MGRQTEISYFDDLIQRNTATIKYLNFWGINIISNIIPINESSRVKHLS